MATDEADVTICLPVYNGEDYLRLALDSLTSQTYPHIKLVISDNASTDETAAISKEYVSRDPRVTYCRQETNVGPLRNFNSHLAGASTPYFMWASHDDLWSPNYVADLVMTFEASPGAALVYSDVQEIDEAGRETIARSLAGLSGGATTFRLLASLLIMHEGGGKANMVYGMVRTEILQRVGGMDTTTRYEWGVDNLLLYRIALEGHFQHCATTKHYKRNFGAKIDQERDRSPESISTIRKARGVHNRVSTEIARAQASGLEPDAVSRVKLSGEFHGALRQYKRAFDFLLEYWPPLLEYFENIGAVIDAAPISEHDRAFLRVLLHVRAANWLVPLTDESGRVSPTQLEAVADALYGYVTAAEAGALSSPGDPDNGET